MCTATLHVRRNLISPFLFSFFLFLFVLPRYKYAAISFLLFFFPVTRRLLYPCLPSSINTYTYIHVCVCVCVCVCACVCVCVCVCISCRGDGIETHAVATAFAGCTDVLLTSNKGP